MKAYLPTTIVVTFIAAMAGCASAPTARAPVAAPAASAAAKAPATAQAPLTDDAAATMAAARSLGYVPRTHNGTIVYCRTEPQIGTRVQSTTCISQEQVASAVQRSVGNRDSVEAMQKKSLLQSQGN